MPYDPNLHHRRSVRLKGWDYAAAAGYFVTICTFQRECTLGEISKGIMTVSDAGRVIEECWYVIPDHFPDAILDAFIVMPNHLHGILILTKQPRIKTTVGAHESPLQASARPAGPDKAALGAILGLFKASASKRIRSAQTLSEYFRWQRSFYDHIIRHDDELAATREYIINNPLDWETDEHHPSNLV